ncbi:hypothetical protein [Streptomyces sp. TRM68367]|uniref:hypothetical protein n=1 Tax=Streptomyces sp. TRM68367 TaxID=2758415 RepID=UPI00165AAC78|nr:hypothetical protein [Streptomyces sp. TRM68367]MBC9730759.1 hypothetical protein [Streptomyces sp. TRM68367]
MKIRTLAHHLGLPVRRDPQETAKIIEGLRPTLDELPDDKRERLAAEEVPPGTRHLVPTPSLKARQWWWPCRPRVSTGVAPAVAAVWLSVRTFRSCQRPV